MTDDNLIEAMVRAHCYATCDGATGGCKSLAKCHVGQPYDWNGMRAALAVVRERATARGLVLIEAAAWDQRRQANIDTLRLLDAAHAEIDTLRKALEEARETLLAYFQEDATVFLAHETVAKITAALEGRTS